MSFQGVIPLKLIKTERLVLRPVKISDAPLMHAAMKVSFPVLKQWMPWAQGLASIRDTEVYLMQGRKIWSSIAQEGVEQPLQILDLQEKIYYGATGIKPINLQLPSFEVGYWINQTYAARGLITEALNALCHYLFQVLAAKRIEINCEEENQRSARVAERLHFDLEAKLRNHRLTADGKRITHSRMYACIDEEQLPPLLYTYE